VEDFLFSLRLGCQRIESILYPPTQASKQVAVARRRKGIRSHTRAFVLHNPTVRIEYPGPKSVNFFPTPPLILFFSFLK